MVVLGLGLLLTGGLYALFSPANADADATDLVEEGRQLYLVGCASCHGKNGEGVLTENGNQYGPPLIGVGAASADFQLRTGRMPMARPGTQAEEKPVQYDEEQIQALAAYVASLGPGPAIPPESAYDISKTTDEDIAIGGELYRTNCAACHNFAGAGGPLPRGRYAPALHDSSPLDIYEALITGPSQMPVFSDEAMTPQDKRSIIAYLLRLREQANYGGSPAGNLGPVAEGVFAWVVGLGALVLATIWIAAKGVKVKGTPNA